MVKLINDREVGSLRKRLMSGGLGGLTIKILSGLLAFMSFAVMSNATSADSYGNFVAAFSLALFIGQVATFGQPKTALRYLGEYSRQELSPEAAGVFRYGLRLILMVSAACAAFNVVIWTLISSVKGDFNYEHFVFASLLIVPVALAEYLSHALRGLQHLISAMLPRDILWRLSLLIIAYVCVATSYSPSADELIAVAALFLGLFCTLQLIIAWKACFRRFGSIYSFSEKLRWKDTAFGQWGVSIFSTSFPHVSTLYVGVFLTATEAGAFFSSVRIVSLLSMALIAINFVSAPLIARYIGSGDIAKVQFICKISAGLVCPLVIIGGLVIVTYAENLLNFFNGEFIQYQSALYILCGSYALNAMLGPTGSLMQMSGNEKVLLKYTIISYLLGLCFLPILSSYFGIAGAAIAFSLASSGWNILVWIWALRNMKIDSSVLSLLHR